MNRKFKRKVLFALAAILISASFTGCGEDKESSIQEPGELTIVTSFYPIYIAAINVAKDIPGVTVTNMAEPQTGCLHDYSLTTKDMKKLAEADVFIINGAGMESFIDKALKQNNNLKVLDSSKDIELIKDEETGEGNPHIWVGISGAAEQVKNIGKQLAEIDNAHASQYTENTRVYVEKLEALRGKMHDKLDSFKNKNIVTFHEAFPYFAKEFNLDIKAVVAREPGTEPSAGELAETIQIVKASGVRALFAEPQYSQKAAELIAKETDAKIYTLDPVVTGEANGDTDAYLKVMKANLATLEEAFTAYAK